MATKVPKHAKLTVVVMPASALDRLSRLNIVYPMMFRVRGEGNQNSTFCGVLEFSAQEGVVYLPPWMLKTLRIASGDLVNLTNVALSVGTYIKIQPQSVDFLDITDPRAVLEHSLRNFATLTVGDCVAVNYNTKIYELLVLEVKPNDGRGSISVLETDLQVEFAAPLGYEEPQARPKSEKSIASSLDVNAQLSTSAVSSSNASAFMPFSGSAQRLSNRPKQIRDDVSDSAPSTASTTASTSSTAPAPLALPKGTLFFGGATKKPTPTTQNPESTTHKFNAFSGQGRKLQ
ncbi:hypothetical protein PSACC_00185 [Paramicrosporidium saccamoebae]|uniref:Uncharacterized protein n=1 Tax=Paramicrosporidium saccamoebae TaxID=1246581 RepID=A0A2H9TQK6_9FUNG|nr:hypothetical protein PSACC_00185 [Paramicrosporidium saccamoebae]